MIALGAAARFFGLLLIIACIAIVIDAQVNYDGTKPEDEDPDSDLDEDDLAYRRSLPYDAFGDYSFQRKKKNRAGQK